MNCIDMTALINHIPHVYCFFTHVFLMLQFEYTTYLVRATCTLGILTIISVT